MKKNLNVYLESETIIAIKNFCVEKGISVSSYVQMLFDLDINSGFDGFNKSDSDGLVISYDNEILTMNEARLMLRNHPCFNLLYLE